MITVLRAHPSLREITFERGLAAAAGQVRAQGIEVPESGLSEVAEFVARRMEQ